jgi:hypothetical protein
MAINTCQFCKKSFTSQRSDKKHCSSSCRVADAKIKRNVPAVASEAMKTLGLALGSIAPAGTVGYRLALPKSVLHPRSAWSGELHWFPGLHHRRTLRWDGSYSDRPYFALTKAEFEPPRVPAATVYIIHFIDEKGMTLPTPKSLADGVKISEAAEMSWPGTHGVRRSRNGKVRSLLSLTAISSSES